MNGQKVMKPEGDIESKKGELRLMQKSSQEAGEN
jgi:hypothetical protein